MDVEYLTTDDVEQIHERIIRRYGGASLALRDFGALDSAIAAPQQSVFGTELYPNLADKAAILLFLLVENHAFVDGNKRTAAAAATIFLSLNGFNLEATEDEVFDLALNIATGQTPKDDIATWLQSRITRKD